MLISYEQLLSRPVMSLQTGTELARTKEVLVDPRTLTVIAYELEGPLLTDYPSFLRVADVRELSSMGLIVDSSDEFVGLNDVIKLKEVYEFSFHLVGLQVYDQKKHKLGKTIGFSVEDGNFVVQQVAVKRPLLKSLNDTELLIHRSQITEVNNEHLIVKTGEVARPIKESIREYTNPFRRSATQPESTPSTQYWS